jgi:hypothetical protein
MPTIAKQKNFGRLTRLTVKIPESTLQQLQQYSRFIESSQGYIIVESLQLTFQDPEFQEWTKLNPPLPKQTKPKTPNASTAEPKSVSIAAAPLDLTKTLKTAEKR